MVKFQFMTLRNALKFVNVARKITIKINFGKQNNISVHLAKERGQ